jgi:HD-like signal output (HDOD) protein
MEPLDTETTGPIHSEDQEFGVVRPAVDASDVPLLDDRFGHLFAEVAAVDAQALVDCLRRDPSLAERVLRTANSPYYAAPRCLTAVNQAILALGVTAIRGIAIGASFEIASRSLPSSDSGIVGHLWQHSLATAAAARLLARRLRPLDAQLAEDAFLVGLVHDIGVLAAMYQREQGGANPVVAGSARTNTARRFRARPADWALLVGAHASVAAVLFARWGFPASVVELVLTHHEPLTVGADSQLRRILLVADHMAAWSGYGSLEHDGSQTVDSNVLRSLGLEEDAIPGLVDSLVADARRLAEAFKSSDRSHSSTVG